MMNIITIFKINDEKYFELLVPDVTNKFNYSYEPTEKLHKFDKITVAFKESKKNKEFEVSGDMAYLILETFQFSLKNALDNKTILPNIINAGEVGYYYNIDLSKEEYSEELLDFSRCSLWSGKDIQTWMYNKNNKIYLEISPAYPWFYNEPTDDDNYIPFDEFIKMYKPIAVEEIDPATAQKWLEQCNEILNTIADQDHS